MRTFMVVVFSLVFLFLASWLVWDLTTTTEQERLDAAWERIQETRQAYENEQARKHGVAPGTEEASLIGSKCPYQLKVYESDRFETVYHQWNAVSKVEKNDDGDDALTAGDFSLSAGQIAWFWDCEEKTLRSLRGPLYVRLMPSNRMFQGGESLQ